MKAVAVSFLALSTATMLSAQTVPPTSKSGTIQINSTEHVSIDEVDIKERGAIEYRQIELGKKPRPVVSEASYYSNTGGLPASYNQSRMDQVRSLMERAGFNGHMTNYANANSVEQAMLAEASLSDVIASQEMGGCEDYPYRPTGLISATAEKRRSLLFPRVRAAACAAGIPVPLFDALVIQESRYNPLAVSHKGAVGLAQLMPGTAKQLKVDQYTIDDNLRGGAKLLRQHLDQYNGQAHLALAAYNAGPGAVAKYGGVPRYKETMNYVKVILSMWNDLEAVSGQ